MKKFIKLKVLSRAAGISGSLLIMLLIPELLNISYLPSIFSHLLKITLWRPLLFGLFLTLFWLLTAKGFKGFYFSITALTGVVFILIPLLVSMGSLGELETITELLHPSYLKFEEEVESYIAELLDNNSLSKAEKEQLINE